MKTFKLLKLQISEALQVSMPRKLTAFPIAHFCKLVFFFEKSKIFNLIFYNQKKESIIYPNSPILLSSQVLREMTVSKEDFIKFEALILQANRRFPFIIPVFPFGEKYHPINILRGLV